MPPLNLSLPAARFGGPPKRKLPGQGLVWPLAFLLVACVVGCGTTRWSDTQRTATEQFLVSHAIDQAVGRIDLSALAGRHTYFDPSYLEDTVQKGYLVSSLRQHILASGCFLQEDRASADYVIEARTGVVGTNRNESFLGIPALSLPPVYPGVPTQTPEIAFAKETNQMGAAKIAVYAYNRRTGERVWQSGMVVAEAGAKNNWFFGIGPREKTSFSEETKFIGARIRLPFTRDRAKDQKPPLLTQQATWLPDSKTPAPLGAPVERAGHSVILEGVQAIPADGSR